jgi:excisionase family DNA binding protein
MEPPASTRSEPLTYSVETAATMLGISRTLAYQLVRGGELPSIKLGRRVVVPRAALLRLVGGAGIPPKRGGIPYEEW